MSESNKSPLNNPSNFMRPGTKGRGVRRLNRLPLLFFGGICLITIGAIGYTVHVREVDEQAVTGQQVTTSQQAADDSSILKNAPNGPIAALENSSSTVTPAFQLSSQHQESHRLSQPNENSGAEQMDQEAERIRQEKIQELDQIIQMRTQSESAALTSPSSVDFDLSKSNRSASPNSANDNAAEAALDALAHQGAANAAPVNSPADPNGQDEKNNFNQTQKLQQQLDTLQAARMPTASPYEIRAGAVIPAVMIGGVNSDLPGQILGQVRENVYDTATGQYLLIPQGSKVVGTYDSRVTMGQNRVLVVWNRLIYPDGSSLDLGGMSGADQGGYAGFSDQVNNHYLQVFGSALMLSLFSAGIQLSQPGSTTGGSSYSSQQIIAGSVGQQLGNAGISIIQRNLDIQPTLTIRPGYLFNVQVEKDIIVSPYVGNLAN